jgi:restriction endonuclease S subunit
MTKASLKANVETPVVSFEPHAEAALPSNAWDGRQLPSDWRSVTLGELGTVRYGLSQPPEQADDGAPMIRATNVKRGRIVKDGLIRVRQEAIPEARNPYLKSGDIIVVRSGAYTGDVAMITDEWAGSVAGYDLIFSPSASISPAYCAAVLLTDDVQKYFRSERARSAQPHLNRHQLEQTIVPLPELSEQLKIVKVLSLVARAITQQERLLALTAELGTALLHHLFAYGLSHETRKQTDIGLMPASWEIVPLTSVICAELQNGVFARRKQFGSGILFANVADMYGETHLDPSRLDAINGQRFLPVNPIIQIGARLL